MWAMGSGIETRTSFDIFWVMTSNQPKQIQIKSLSGTVGIRFQTAIIFIVIDENIVSVGSRSQIDFKGDLHDWTPLQHSSKTALWVLQRNIPKWMTLFRNEVVDNFVVMSKQSQEQTLDIRRMLPLANRALVPSLVMKIWIRGLISPEVRLIKYS